MLCKESWMMNKMRLRHVDKPMLCEKGHVGTCDFQQMLKIMVRISPNPLYITTLELRGYKQL